MGGGEWRVDPQETHLCSVSIAHHNKEEDPQFHDWIQTLEFLPRSTLVSRRPLPMVGR
jgi:hypothetical protein